MRLSLLASPPVGLLQAFPVQSLLVSDHPGKFPFLWLVVPLNVLAVVDVGFRWVTALI